MSQKIKNSVFAILFSIFFTGCQVLPFEAASQGALQVTSNSSFAVYLNEEHLGQTPFFDERIKVGEHILKLVGSQEGGEGVWQTKVNISKRALTVVNYDFAPTAEESSSEILQLEPLSQKEAKRLSVSTLPENVTVKLNGQVKGFSPISFDDLDVTDYELVLEAPGYKPKTLNVKINNGHHLIIQAHLGRDSNLAPKTPSNSPEASASAQITQSQTQEATQGSTPVLPGTVIDGVIIGQSDPSTFTSDYVEILEASPGIDWLRVRSSPTATTINEVARVKVGTYFPLGVAQDLPQWRQIQYQPDELGWVSLPATRLIEVD